MKTPFHDYISIDTNSIMDNGSYTQPIVLDDGTWYFTFKWNAIDRSFTVDIADDDGIIKSGVPLRLGVPLWFNNSDPRLPSDTLEPLSNDFDKDITPVNLNQSVFLCIVDTDESDGDDGITA